MSVADRVTVEGWCERGEEGRVEAWLEEGGSQEKGEEGCKQEKGEEGKLPVKGLIHAGTRCDRISSQRKNLFIKSIVKSRLFILNVKTPTSI